MDQDMLIELKNVSKHFPGVKALQDVNLQVKKGEVHAIVGENGAGKSTIMNIMFGTYPQTEGKIFWKGKEVRFRTPLDAQNMGIGMVHQENSLFPFLDVQNNIFMGHYPASGAMIKRDEVKRKTVELLEELHLEHIRPGTTVADLGMADKQLIEIAKALSQHPDFIMFDEPTAALTNKETAILMDIIRDLKQKGVGIVYVSHRLNEIFELADTVTILRDGQHVVTGPVGDFDNDKVVQYMVGRQLDDQMHSLKKNAKHGPEDKTILEVRSLSKKGAFEDVSFELKKGEVLGFAGLVGAGRSEILEAIFGYEPADSGEIFVEGKKMNMVHPQVATEAGLGLIPEERKVKGLFLELSVRDNINIATIRECKTGTLVNRKKEIERAEQSVKQLNIKTPTVEKAIINLSGGNQQKAILSRWLLAKPKILMLDEPTHGIDVGAKAEIYSIIDNLTKEGVSVILVSSELPELLLLSDRIAIMYHGKMTGIVERSELNDDAQEVIMRYATGQG